MKRIVLINNDDRALSYGIGSYTENLIECLKKTGFAFDIACLNADVHELKIVDHSRYREFFIPAFAGSNNKKIFSYSQMLPFLFKELFSAGDDLVFHFNYFYTDTFIAKLKTLFNCKVLLTVHYTEWSLILNGDFRRLKSLSDKVKNGQTISPSEKGLMNVVRTDKDIFRQVDLILFVSQHTVKTYSALTILKESKYTIVHNGLKDTYRKLSRRQKSAIRKRYHISEHETILFFAGRLDRIKGIDGLIEAFQKVLRLKPEAHLFIAGEGDFLILLSKSRFACTKITFLGFLCKSELYDFYNIADIGISCSIHEEFGLVALEMMMHKLPVIVTNTGGLAEIVDDGMNGLKVPIVYKKGKRTVDSKELARKIIFLVENPGEGKRLGENARKKFLANYELSMFGTKMIQIYNSMNNNS